MTRPNRQIPPATKDPRPDLVPEPGIEPAIELCAAGIKPAAKASHPAILALARLLGRSAARACVAQDSNHREHDANAEEA